MSYTDEQQSERGSTSNTLLRRTERLQTIAEIGVIGESPLEQTRRILEDSVAALQFDYGEFGEANGEADSYVRLCVVGAGAENLERGVGWRGLDREKPFAVFDTVQEGFDDEAVRALGLKSLLFWPFTAEGKRCVLCFGWKRLLDEFISEEEIEYIDVLVTLVARLLKALDQARGIAERADTDSLTGIPNRNAVLQHLGTVIAASQRSGANAAVLYIDLNHFKRINDEHGHAVGDAALRGVASRLKSVLRKHEVIGRLGGDEFCLVVSSFREEDELQIIARRVLDTLSEPTNVGNGLTLYTSGSIGIAIYPRDGTTAAELLSRADQAMYRAKVERSPSFAFYGAAAVTAVEQPMRIDLADFSKRFVLCYQPIVAARSGRPIAAEVLSRWLQDDGMRLPGKFLQAAQEQGVLSKLDGLILQSAMQRVAHHHAGHCVLHVNVSEPDPAFADSLPALTAPVALELSEEQVADNTDGYLDFAAACRARGYRVGISRFGWGRLPLRALAEMRPDFVKISMADVRESAARRGERDYLRTMIDQAHRMSALVIAEAVETESEREWLVASGVDALQGYEISSPLAEEDFFLWLRRYS
ncbi:MAG TPA: diguanylate cyclase [Candidatus Baltobacteraceae bacterium]|nr:diguanylate cyclase [Candidatus Baltobacteraceae bacterium]